MIEVGFRPNFTEFSFISSFQTINILKMVRLALIIRFVQSPLTIIYYYILCILYTTIYIMITGQAGNEFGAATPYGSALIRVGQTEQK